jgi:hypothetical protein
MTTREYVKDNFRSNDERGLALLADLFEAEDWTTEALEKIAYDSKLELPATISFKEPCTAEGKGWKITVEESHIRHESNEVGIVAPYKYPSTIVVEKPEVKRFYDHNGRLIRMVYNCIDREIEACYWQHYIRWTVKFRGGKCLSIEVDDTRHHFNFDDLAAEQILACELALNLLSENEAVSEDTYRYICDTLCISKEPVSRFYMSMHEKKDGEPIGLLREKLLYIDGQMEEKAVVAGDFTFLKFKHGLKKIFGRDSKDRIWNITYGLNGEIQVNSEEPLFNGHLSEILKWAESVFETF